MRRVFLLFFASLLLLVADLLAGSLAGGWSSLRVLLYLAGLWLFALGAIRLGDRLLAGFSWPASLLAVLGVLIGGRWLSLQITHTPAAAFFRSLSGLTAWNPSVGDFLINACWLLMLAAWFHRRLSYDRQQPARAAWAVAGFGLSTLGLTGHAVLTRQLVLAGGQGFDFDHVFQLGFSEVLSLSAILLLLVALFVFTHRIILLAQRWAPNRNRRLLCLVGGLLLAGLPVLFVSTGFSGPVFLLIAFAYLALCDLFIETRFPGMTQLTVWLFLFSVYGAGLLYKNQLDRNRLQRIRYARILSEPGDRLATVALSGLLDSMAPWTPNDRPVSARALRRTIDARLAGMPYLFRYYRYDLFSLHPPERPPLVEGKRTADARAALKRTVPSETPGLRRWVPAGQPYYYLLQIPTGSRDSSYLILAFRREQEEVVPGYRLLMRAPGYRGLSQLDQYDYAVYRQGQRVEGTSVVYPRNLQQTVLPDPGTWREQFKRRRVDLIFQADNGSVVRIGRPFGGPLKPATLFSYLFLLLSLLVILLAALNRFFESIPGNSGFPSIGTPSLRSRIQLAVVGLILGSFLLNGLITVTFFRGSKVEDQREDLASTAELVKAELERSLPLDTANTRETLLRAARRFRRSLDLYAEDGSLRSSTSSFVYDAGLRAPQMAAEAFAYFETQPAGMIAVTERLGEQSYLNAYVPLNTRPRSYLGIPSPITGFQPRDPVNELLSSLLNVYAFLLLVAGVVAIAVSNSITQPLTQLGEKLRNLRLGRNDPIDWHGQDEVAELIAAYNRMISELEENTEKLRQSEREGAWREMAQQVAHEIKNPLTPMKLSLQHLQRAYQSDPQRARTLLERTGKTLIEQIDGLARIATEFSTFAKLPPAKPERLHLDELLRSAGELFRQQSTHPQAVQLRLPDESVPVRADRTHLQRIFNNLLQNAWQSIPSGRSAKIEIGLRVIGNRVIARVTDNGTGIPEEIRPHIFEPKFTTKSAGMGLGLAMCKGMVEQMGGRIWFEPQPTEGTTFFVELPGAE